MTEPTTPEPAKALGAPAHHDDVSDKIPAGHIERPHTLQPGQSLAALIAADYPDADMMALYDLVYDVASQVGTDVNNGGNVEQIRYLMDTGGISEAHIRELLNQHAEELRAANAPRACGEPKENHTHHPERSSLPGLPAPAYIPSDTEPEPQAEPAREHHPDPGAAPTPIEGPGPSAELPDPRTETQTSTAHPRAFTPAPITTHERSERLYRAMLEAAGQFGVDGMSTSTDDALRTLAQIIVAEG